MRIALTASDGLLSAMGQRFEPLVIAEKALFGDEFSAFPVLRRRFPFFNLIAGESCMNFDSASERGEDITTPMTKEQVDEIVRLLKKYIVGFSVLNDIVIKFLLGEPGAEERLKNFLNAIRKQLGQPLIERVIIRPSENFPAYPMDKISFLDIKAEDSNGTIYNIEVQLAEQPSFISRVIYYGTKLHSSQLVSGADYGDICPTICIIITRFDLFPELSGVFQSFRLANESNPDLILSDDLQFHFIQITKVCEQTLSVLTEDLADWIRFFNFPKTSEETMKTVLFKNSALAHSGRALSRFVAVDQERERIEYEEKQRRDYQDMTVGQFLKGKAEGIEIGKVEGIEIGKVEGKAEGVADLIVKMSGARLGEDLPEDMVEKIHTIQDVSILNELAMDLMISSDIDDFRGKLVQRLEK